MILVKLDKWHSSPTFRRKETRLTGQGHTKSDEIARSLELQILQGHRKPGERLDERSLADEYAVSRTPIREALQRLAATGLVTLSGRRGASVTKLSVSALMDAFYVVSELEGMAARQAARRMSREDRELLKQAHLDCDAMSRADDVEGFYAANQVFHDLIVNGSKNRFLQDQLHTARLITAPYRFHITYQSGRMAASIGEHEAVLNAILAVDGEAAYRSMRDHVTLLGEGMSDLLHILEDGIEKSPES